RLNVEIEECAGLVPHAIVIASHQAKAVVAWGEIVVEGAPPSAGLLPITIAGFQHVTKENLFGRNEAERGVVDLQVAYQRRQADLSVDIRRRVVCFVVGDETFDMYWWRQYIEMKLMWIDDGEAIDTSKPKLAIRGPYDVRGGAAKISLASYSIGNVEMGNLNGPLSSFVLVRCSGPRVQLGARDAHQTTRSVQPE